MNPVMLEYYKKKYDETGDENYKAVLIKAGVIKEAPKTLKSLYEFLSE